MLNRAHCLERQAEKAARKGRIEEAIQLHKEAADILRDLLQTVIDDKVRESVRLQTQLHEKEKTVLKQQRKRCQKVYKDLESLKGKMSHHHPESRTPGSGRKTPQKSHHHHPHLDETSSLQSSIYRKFQETENLLDQLRIQDGISFDDSDCTSLATTATEVRAAHYVSEESYKKPKDDKVIIEELQTANSHLRKMVDTLFFELSACQEENSRLKCKIRELEEQQQESRPSSSFRPIQTPIESSPRSLRRTPVKYKSPVNDLLDGNEDDMYGIQRIVPSEELPALPPLEMPPAFNFGNLDSPTPSSTLPSSSDESRCPQQPKYTQAGFEP